VPTKIEKLSIDGVGPVRTRVTRLVEAGANRFTQHLDIYGPQKEIRVTTEMTLKDENIFAGLAVPVPPESQLTVDIPFGMERRQPDAIPYGKASEFGWENIERRIPGYFWGRSWVNVSRRDGAFSLLSEDGDRFFRQHPSGSWLVHYFLRVPRRTEGCWEANAGMDRGLGRHVFHHVLVLHGAGFRMADLVNRAEQARFPVSWLPVCLEEEPLNQSWLSVEPETVQISSFYRQGDYAVLRVYNPQETAQSVQVIVPRAPQNVVLTDFNLNPMEGDVRLKKRTLQFDIRPWQIATFRLEF
jgi:alpha-mannosidase